MQDSQNPRTGATACPTPLAEAVELWALYRHYTERHDRRICTGKKCGVPFPMTVDEKIACARHSMKLGRLTRRLINRQSIFATESKAARLYVMGLEDEQLAVLVLHSKWMEEYERETD